MPAHPGVSTLQQLHKTLSASVQRSSVKRYFARVDAHIADMSEREAIAFLRVELDKWQARYSRFQQQVFTDKYTGDATAWDYCETIATIGARLARLEKRVAA